MLTTSRLDAASDLRPEPRAAHLPLGMPHQLEADVQRRLLADPGLQFSSLVIRRIEDGVCLTGVLESSDGAADPASIARRVAGVNNVLNHLVNRSARGSN